MALIWRGDEAMRRVHEGAARGLTRAAKALLAESQSRVPHDTGDLRRSGTVHPATPGHLESAVTYTASSPGGFPYGIAVHEGTHMSFKSDHNPKAQAKYLEGPAKEMEDKLMQMVALEIKRTVG